MLANCAGVSGSGSGAKIMEVTRKRQPHNVLYSPRTSLFIPLVLQPSGWRPDTLCSRNFSSRWGGVQTRALPSTAWHLDVGPWRYQVDTRHLPMLKAGMKRRPAQSAPSLPMRSLDPTHGPGRVAQMAYREQLLVSPTTARQGCAQAAACLPETASPTGGAAGAVACPTASATGALVPGPEAGGVLTAEGPGRGRAQRASAGARRRGYRLRCAPRPAGQPRGGAPHLSAGVGRRVSGDPAAAAASACGGASAQAVRSRDVRRVSAANCPQAQEMEATQKVAAGGIDLEGRQ